MSDISFNGLGAFALFLFTAVLFAFILVFLLVRQLILYKNSDPFTVRCNSIFVLAGLFPFGAAIAGLIIIQVINDIYINRLMDQYLAIALLCGSFLLAIIWVLISLKRLRKDFTQVDG
ncbi:MAG: hypothetical protein RI924_359 [Bacteroidota bacterium]|jgi:hypothetical protein